MTSPAALFVDNRPLRLGKRIGKGGEGEVFIRADAEGQAVKIYTKPDKEREAKVAAMIRVGLAKRSDLISFPLEAVRDSHGRFVGFTMRLVNGHISLHELYAPGSRKIHFPKADYRFTIRAAANVARSVAKVHELGVVIGDINHSGVLISDKAVAALIDADSFQFGTQFLCRVGVPEYTPPELQGQRLGGIIRTVNHDAFGLAVVIFQLLFMGRHPFMGRYSGPGEMTIEKAISESRFAYSKQRTTGMAPPPGVCQLTDFPPFIGAAFEAAFASKDCDRPTALQWVKLLGALEAALTKCSANEMHFYPTAASQCIWCRMEQQIGIMLFLPAFHLGPTSDVRDPGAAGFNLAAVWAKIESVLISNPAAFNPMLPQIDVGPSDEARTFKSDAVKARAFGLVAIAVAIALLLFYPALWLVYVPTAWFGVARAFSTSDGNTAKFTSRFKEADAGFVTAIDGWRRRIGVTEMLALRQSLEEAKTKLQGLPQEERRRIAEHEATRRDTQLHDHLERYPIRRGNIRGVGPAKLAALASYGIDTAADIVLSRIVAVPGFGAVSAQPLIQWRDRVAKRFVFQATPSSAERQEVQRIRQSCMSQAAQLRTALLNGANDLPRLSASVQGRTKASDPATSKAHADREQARFDLQFLGIAVPQTTAIPTVKPFKVIPVGHVRSATQPAIPASISTACPTCGGRMVKRTARRGRNSGRQFWGCAAYPRCRGTRPI